MPPTILLSFDRSIFYCKFPTYIANTITKYFDKVYNDSQPEFIFMVEPVFLYNVFFEQFSIIDYIQLTHLILVAKHRCLKIANNEVIAKWNCHFLLHYSNNVIFFNTELSPRIYML